MSDFIQGLDVPKDPISKAVAIAGVGSSTFAFYSNSDSFPVTLASNATGLSIFNTGSVSLTFTITKLDETTLSSTVPAGAAYNGVFKPFYKLDISGASTWLAEVKA